MELLLFIGIPIFVVLTCMVLVKGRNGKIRYIKENIVELMSAFSLTGILFILFLFTLATSFWIIFFCIIIGIIYVTFFRK